MSFLAPLAEEGAAGTGAAATEEGAATEEEGAAEKKGAKNGGSLLALSPQQNLGRLLPAGGGAFFGQKVIVAEFVACMVLIAITPLVTATVDTVAWLKRGAACSGLFLVLALVGTGGPRASRIAAAFGGLVTLGLLITDRAVFGQIVALLGGGQAADTDTEDVADINAVLGDGGE